MDKTIIDTAFHKWNQSLGPTLEVTLKETFTAGWQAATRTFLEHVDISLDAAAEFQRLGISREDLTL